MSIETYQNLEREARRYLKWELAFWIALVCCLGTAAANQPAPTGTSWWYSSLFIAAVCGVALLYTQTHQRFLVLRARLEILEGLLVGRDR